MLIKLVAVVTSKTVTPLLVNNNCPLLPNANVLIPVPELLKAPVENVKLFNSTVQVVSVAVLDDPMVKLSCKVHVPTLEESDNVPLWSPANTVVPTVDPNDL